MSLDTTEAIQKVFCEATRQALVKHLKYDGDWDRFNGITEEAEQRIQQENTDWKNDYHSRLAEARQIILRETHGNILAPPKPKGIDAIPNKTVLDQKADARIRQDHHRRLSVIRQDEIDQYQELSQFVIGRESRKGEVTRDFAKTQSQNQTRSGPSRS